MPLTSIMIGLKRWKCITMKTVKIKELTEREFSTYGTFASLTELTGTKLGKAPIDFFPDLVQISIGKDETSASVCRFAPRPFVIDVIERHETCGEGILPLDGDVLIHVGLYCDNASGYDQLEVFRVPQYTMVSLRPNVWHHAPFALGDSVVHTLIVLPKKTYANDCISNELPADRQIRISM